VQGGAACTRVIVAALPRFAVLLPQGDIEAVYSTDGGYGALKDLLVRAVVSRDFA
jgi:hypothetical protein